MSVEPSPPTISFHDGAAYERYMGKWSQLVGETFLDWLAPASGLRWLDVGCGNGAFTSMILERCAPADVAGVDPSEAQLAYARTRGLSAIAHFHQGDAMALPFPDDAFDVAVMPLVIFFVPEPPRGVAEMARVVGAGGSVAAYAWDMCEGGFPYFALQAELRALDVPVPSPPNPDASRLDSLRQLWDAAGLVDVHTREIVVRRTFAGFDDYWATVQGAPSMGRQLAAMDEWPRRRLEAAMRERLQPNADGLISITGRANAVKARVPSAPRRHD